ncbi:MAG: PAS domain S-box protein [Xanthobacteraceae bacterium]|nr:PAS domain S-box protein [Xanthobacteraceae bacterium]
MARPAALPEPPALPALARRSPLRFVWQIDAEGRFTLATREFAEVMGPSTLAVLGRSWPEIAAALALDPDQRVARAIASRDTWSGIAVAWPVDGSDERAQVELSGLPAFDRTRAFLGYRGFGVCRDIARFADVIAARGGASATPAAEPPPPAPEETVPVPTAEAGETETREAAPAPEERAAEARPMLTVVPPVQNVVPFRTAAPADRRPTLTAVEHSAFKQIAEALGGPAAEEPEAAPPAEAATPAEPVPATEPAPAMEPAPTTEAVTEEPAADDWGVETEPVADAGLVPAAPTPERRVRPVPSAFAPVPGVADAALAGADAEARLILERLPIAILVHRDAQLVYANRTFLEWTGYADLKDVVAAGGLDRLVPDGSGALDKANGTGRTFALATRGGGSLAAEGRLCTVPWEGAPALMLALTRTVADERLKSSELARGDAEREARELRSILDTATDGIIVIDREGRVLSINRSAEALFGYDYHEIIRKPFWLLFAPESERAARDYLDGLTRNGVASVLNDGREVIGRVQQGGLIPLFMTMGRVGDSGDKFCAVFRDITQWKRAEEDLTNAKREAERASSAKSDFLAKISHEIRTPLNAIIGFSEVMMEERFGNVGNERYRQYLNDIHTSGQHLVSLINDLLDLSKIEAGKLDLVFASVNLNELVQQCVALMQPQANRERIIIRTSLSPTLPPVVIDARSVRQIVLNLLSNSIKFTGAAGQVIVSTALTDRGEAVLRVRDTGVGMSEKEIETALEPFRQLSTSTRWGSGGTGLGLPLTKALAEANRATFAIKSAANAGTLVEITFPATRVLAE